MQNSLSVFLNRDRSGGPERCGEGGEGGFSKVHGHTQLHTQLLGGLQHTVPFVNKSRKCGLGLILLELESTTINNDRVGRFNINVYTGKGGGDGATVHCLRPIRNERSIVRL